MSLSAGTADGISPSPVQVFLSGSVSSQFLTALLMAAPLSTSKEGIEIIIKVSAQRCRMLGGRELMQSAMHPAGLEPRASEMQTTSAQFVFDRTSWSASPTRT